MCRNFTTDYASFHGLSILIINDLKLTQCHSVPSAVKSRHLFIVRLYRSSTIVTLLINTLSYLLCPFAQRLLS
ncbi:hypothetical protein IA74_021455 [Bacteroides fragilis]|uniref:Uncharacterized protein n=1 Tax=Bacteroides fragilis TaxID=817 RepID=A0AAP8ZWT0_BACFG|nr:hypothetical protein IA74_021455 [Bacteroides fragilis]